MACQTKLARVKFPIWENFNDYNSNGDKFMRVYEAPIRFWCFLFAGFLNHIVSIWIFSWSSLS